MSSASPRVAVRRWFEPYAAAWDRFWFTPRLPHTLAALRIVTGAMLLYAHLVLATDLTSFLGDHAWVNNETARQLHDGAFGFSDLGRSYLWYISNPLLLWMHHLIVLLVTASFAAGFMTRITAPATWFFQLMYLHRLTGTLFGLDQILTYSVMYLMLSPCGSCFSVDGWLREKLAERRSESSRLRWLLPEATPSVAANIATRLFQLHLCVIYLFGGLAKARGQSWWDGTALWYAVGNYEYQSIDTTWIINYPRLFTALTHATLFWEIFYCALVWPRITRPLTLAVAVAVHGGIALFLGMITFGVMMIAANMIFVRPETLLRWIRRGDMAEGYDAEGDGADGDDAAGDDAAGDRAEADSDPSASPAYATHQEEYVEADEMSFEALNLEELGLEEFDTESHGSDVLSRGIDRDASASGILDELVKRDASMARREQRLRDASQSLREKKKRLNEQLEKYNERVARLKERETKIKRLVDRKRKNK